MIHNTVNISVIILSFVFLKVGLTYCSLRYSKSLLIQFGLLDHTPYLSNDNRRKQPYCDQCRHELLLDDTDPASKSI